MGDAQDEWLGGRVPLKHEMAEGGTVLEVHPSPRLDMWRRTYYRPAINKCDAECWGRWLPADADVRVSVRLELCAKAQFDQAGLCVYVDDDHWLKAGVEVVDGTPRLSCVVTNTFSDWSSQPMAAAPKGGAVELHVRVQKRGRSDYVVEAERDGSWEMVRVLHLASDAPQVFVGRMACCPTAQSGCWARFRDFRVSDELQLTHEAATQEAP